VLALNAGQFSGYTPWGWLVRGGRELREPGAGPLSAAVVVDTAGAIDWVEAGDVAARRARGGVAEAFQSYPVLLAGGRVPAALRAEGLGIDVAHRDARLAIGRRRDGWIVVALTRFDALGAAGGVLPFGLTTPEMAAVMGALGCVEALALDGGLSAQLRLRAADGGERLWSGLRRVPLGLVVERR
jgi:exopolysaccharide biosynthesis protein